ncbi:MAG: hypothetical protein ACLU9X_10760 [Alistipes shahii]
MLLTALLLGMMGCSEETITYTNPVPGDETVRSHCGRTGHLVEEHMVRR